MVRPEAYAVLSRYLGLMKIILRKTWTLKVTGTLIRREITACQWNIKIKGLSYEIFGKSIKTSTRGRLHILK